MNSTAANQPRLSGISGINLLAGIWFIISPWVLGSLVSVPATWNNIAGGGVILIVAVARMASLASGWSLLNALLGAWMIASPWIFGFAKGGNYMWNNIIVGAVVLIVAFMNSPRAAPASTDV